MDESNYTLDEALQNIVKNQIRKYDPPETKQTYNRLIKEGLLKDEVMRQIVYVLSAELSDSLNSEEEPFNKERYIKRLKDLPIEPELLKGITNR